MNEQKQKHTPGPWEVGPEGQVRAMTGRQICDPRQWTSEGQANASLIAAAPELLAALRVLVNAAYESANHHSFTPFYLTELAVANAAIAKAEGGVL